MTSPLRKRLFIIATILLVSQGGAFFLLQRAKSSEVRPLTKQLSDMPYEIVGGIGQWKGQDQKTDDEITRTVGARQAISRTYLGPEGRTIAVHIGDWDSLNTPTLPHPPGICYPASGFKITRREKVTIGKDDPVEAEILFVEHSGYEAAILYWYGWEELVCTTRGQACLARLKMIGRRDWPPVVKVMLDTPSGGNELQAIEDLKDLGSEIREWTKTL